MTERTHDYRDPSQLRDEAVRVYDQLSEGGLAIVPLSVAYAIVGCTEAGIRRIFAAKQRSYGKPSGLFGSPAWSEALHVLRRSGGRQSASWSRRGCPSPSWHRSIEAMPCCRRWTHSCWNTPASPERLIYL